MYLAHPTDPSKSWIHYEIDLEKQVCATAELKFATLFLSLLNHVLSFILNLLASQKSKHFCDHESAAPMRVRLSPEEFENMHADTTDRNLKLSKMTESQVCGASILTISLMND